MRTKSILQFVISGEDKHHLDDAVNFAEANGLHLRIVVPGIVPEDPIALETTRGLRNWSERRTKVLHEMEQLAETMEQTLQNRGVAGDVSHHLCEERDLATLAGLHARYVDLALWRKPAAPSKRHQQLLLGLIFQSGRPLMVTPDGRQPTIEPKRVIIAWNGRLEAVRAVHASLDLLSAADQVSVAMIDPSFAQWGNGQEPGFDIASLLARHTIPTDVIRMESKGREPGILLGEKAQEFGADLIIMGAYGHSRLREWVLGGTSRHMLSETAVPIMMMH
ncbi:universal stress protein [Pararhizobium haloflavum]|uniref:universal stress protein n=1 Tax=Pararhizobium haloflavum TaxID=2037914 RepID=UPI000C199B86|nr:universal stress protein [Pararhizobium haloflavum]